MGEVALNEQGGLLQGCQWRAAVLLQKIYKKAIYIGRQRPLPCAVIIFPDNLSDGGDVLVGAGSVGEKKISAAVMNQKLFQSRASGSKKSSGKIAGVNVF